MKLIDIKPSFLPETGDCTSAIICKLFEFWGLENYEIIFQQSGSFMYDTIANGAYNINRMGNSVLILKKSSRFN